MSVDAGIIFYFTDRINPSGFVRALVDTGWGPDPEGEMSLFSPDVSKAPWDNDWETVTGVESSYLEKWAASFGESDREIGMYLFHRESGICGPFLIDADRRSLRWRPDANIPYIVPHRNMVDLSKCASIIFPAIKSAGLMIRHVHMFAR